MSEDITPGQLTSGRIANLAAAFERRKDKESIEVYTADAIALAQAVLDLTAEVTRLEAQVKQLRHCASDSGDTSCDTCEGTCFFLAQE